jgi:hypothetical protein
MITDHTIGAFAAHARKLIGYGNGAEGLISRTDFRIASRTIARLIP